MAAMDIQAYCETHGRGTAASLARRMGVPPVLITQWARGERPVPRDRGPELELHSGFEITAEEACPDAKWVRMPCEGWPKGKPLLDLGPQPAMPAADKGGEAEAAEQHAQAASEPRSGGADAATELPPLDPIAVRQDGTVVDREERGTAKHKEAVFLRTFENRRAPRVGKER